MTFLEEPGTSYGEFTNLDVWKKARVLKLEVYEILKLIPESDGDLRRQMRSSARSVPADISEGHGENTPRDEHHFCVIARGSLKETCNHPIDAYGCGYVTRERLALLKPAIDDTVKLLNGYLAHLKRKITSTKSKPTNQLFN